MPIIIEDLEEYLPVTIDSAVYQLRRFEDHAVLIRKSNHDSVLFVGEDCLLWDIQLDLARHRSHGHENNFQRQFDLICERLEIFGLKDTSWHPLPKGWKSFDTFISKPTCHGVRF